MTKKFQHYEIAEQTSLKLVKQTKPSYILNYQQYSTPCVSKDEHQVLTWGKCEVTHIEGTLVMDVSDNTVFFKKGEDVKISIVKPDAVFDEDGRVVTVIYNEEMTKVISLLIHVTSQKLEENMKPTSCQCIFVDEDYVGRLYTLFFDFGSFHTLCHVNSRSESGFRETESNFCETEINS